MYQIKQKPEDFIVEELIDLPLGEGPYSYYKLTKRDMTTLDAVQRIAQAWHIKPKFINFAGIKDKYAISTQYISIHHGPRKDITLDLLQLEFLGSGSERLNVGVLKGNFFRIVVRDTEAPHKQDWFINYFDDQRFGSKGDNHLIGKLLLHKKYGEACNLLGIQANGNDFIGALRSQPKKILQMYLHAYQSYLWNETVKLYLQKLNGELWRITYTIGELYVPKEKPKQLSVPLIGFNLEHEQLPQELRDILKSLLIHEGITERDFIIRSFPELTFEGDMRNVVVDVSDAQMEYTTDQKICTLTCTLPKGAYATMYVKHIFQEQII